MAVVYAADAVIKAALRNDGGGAQGFQLLTGRSAKVMDTKRTGTHQRGPQTRRRRGIECPKVDVRGRCLRHGASREQPGAVAG